MMLGSWGDTVRLQAIQYFFCHRENWGHFSLGNLDQILYQKQTVMRRAQTAYQAGPGHEHERNSVKKKRWLLGGF